MSILVNFPPPPPKGFVTLSEQNGQLVTVNKKDALQDVFNVPGYPDVAIPKDTLRVHSHKETAKSAFLPHDETVFKRTLHAWYESGFSGAFEEIVNNEDHVPSWMASTFRVALAVSRWTNSLHGSLFPHLSLSTEEIISQFTTIANWDYSPVRAFCWHPHTIKFAFALPDDSVQVRTAANDLVPILKHRMQKNVADLAWMPNSSSVLAVACQTCILIWHVDPMSLATRPSSSSVQVLQQSGHGPVTSLCWDPDGSILLSSSPVDTAIMAWDVPKEVCVPLRRAGGGGSSLVRWSPDGSKVIAATPSTLFRVWEARTWTCEKWSNLAGKCKSACWSPKGDLLLFTIENEPVIYYLTFSRSDESKSVIGGAKSAIACVNLSEAEFEVGDEVLRIGGNVENIVWDPKGERLAVTFRETDNSTNRFIALFRTKTSPVLELTPCGFVRGEDDATPCHVSFQPVYNGGALLSVIWSNGNLSYIPLGFIVANDPSVQRLPVISTADTDRISTINSYTSFMQRNMT